MAIGLDEKIKSAILDATGLLPEQGYWTLYDGEYLLYLSDDIHFRFIPTSGNINGTSDEDPLYGILMVVRKDEYNKIFTTILSNKGPFSCYDAARLSADYIYNCLIAGAVELIGNNDKLCETTDRIYNANNKNL